MYFVPGCTRSTGRDPQRLPDRYYVPAARASVAKGPCRERPWHFEAMVQLSKVFPVPRHSPLGYPADGAASEDAI